MSAHGSTAPTVISNMDGAYWTLMNPMYEKGINPEDLEMYLRQELADAFVLEKKEVSQRGQDSSDPERINHGDSTVTIPGTLSGDSPLSGYRNSSR